MPRTPALIPVYRHHKPSNRGYAYSGGKQHWFRGAHNSPESRAAYAKYLVGRAIGDMPVIAPMPADAIAADVNTLVDAFWTHARGYYAKLALDDAGKPQTVRVPTPQLEHFKQILISLRFHFGSLNTADFGCRQFESLREAWARAGQWVKVDGSIVNHEPWCRSHINKQASRLRHVFAWGVTQDLVPVAVHQKLLLLPGLRRGQAAGNTVAPERRKVRPVESDRAMAIVPHVSRQVGTMVQVQLLTGMRSTEICLMRPRDIDRTAKPWLYTPMFHKTEQHDIARVVRLGKQARKLLRPFLKGRESDAFLFSPAEADAEYCAKRRKNRKTKVQPSQVRRARLAARRTRKRPFQARYDAHSYYHAVRTGCEKAFGMPAEFKYRKCDTPEVRAAKAKKRNEWHAAHSWFPHQARHRAATQFRKHGGLDAAQVQLGHTRQTTTEIYAEADIANSAAVVERMG